MKGKPIPPWRIVNPKDGTEMVRIRGGWFWMGSEDGDGDAYAAEKPRHLHYLAPYYLGIYCVSVAQFARYVKKTYWFTARRRDRRHG